MKLLDWQLKNNITNRALAEKIPCHESMISHFHRGRRNFSTHTALRIEEISKNEVTRMELLYPELQNPEGEPPSKARGEEQNCET